MPNIVLLLGQIAVVLAAARLLGYAVSLIGQPRVVGEMLAGIMLGPSLLGWAAPAFSHMLFPPASLGFLNALSQIGLVFFMFLIGLELDVKLLRSQSRSAVMTSHVSIAVPFFFGSCLALMLYPMLSDDRVGFTSFALFLGAAMSVTAFPVLARILAERGLLKTRLGSIAIAAAAVDDVSAWGILAVVVVISRTSDPVVPLKVMLVGTVAYAAIMLTGVRLGLQRLTPWLERRGQLSQDMVAAIVFFVISSAWATERLGVHAVFGAFLAGVVMPRDDRIIEPLLDRFHDVMVVLFLPLFFAFTGLRTNIALISGGMWGVCALIILVAVAGKFAGSAVAARVSGMGWRESLAIGTLMNTRGLMELVVLNVGLDVGVLSPVLFTMMVLMALVTTFMTSPILSLILPHDRWRVTEEADVRAVIAV